MINAGVAGAGLIADLDFAEWRRILSVNLDGIPSLQAALRAVRDGGSIVTVSSAAGLKPKPGVAAYAASKAGLIQLMKWRRRRPPPGRYASMRSRQAG